jgi:hypothetical protein
MYIDIELGKLQTGSETKSAWTVRRQTVSLTTTTEAFGPSLIDVSNQTEKFNCGALPKLKNRRHSP